MGVNGLGKILLLRRFGVMFHLLLYSGKGNPVTVIKEIHDANSKIKIHLSFGGWCDSKSVQNIQQNPGGFLTAVNDWLVSQDLTTKNIVGIDIDAEGQGVPAIGGGIIDSLADAQKSSDFKFLFTQTIPADFLGTSDNADYINLMSYNTGSSTDSNYIKGQAAALISKLGSKKSKIRIGLPMYGVCTPKVGKNLCGDIDKTPRWTYNTLSNFCINNGGSVSYDVDPDTCVISKIPESRSIINPNKDINSANDALCNYDTLSSDDDFPITCSYDGKNVISQIVQYAKDNKVGGIMFWQLGQDTIDSKTSLSQMAHDVIKPSSSS
jgi:GH18 family chitinase